MDSLKLASFLYTRIQETIDNKQYIEEISILYNYAETYGNKYIQVSYMIQLNEKFESLPNKEKDALFHKTPNYTFTLSTNKGEYRYNEKKKMLRILEFKHIYESLASYAVLQFEKYLNQGTAIKVKGIDLWPDANYAEKYLLTESQARYRGFMVSNFEQEVSHWSRLHQLAKKSRKIYAKEKEHFNITDTNINILFELEIYSIQSILLKNEVPIKIKGIKTIDEIHIHTAKLVEALKKEIKSEYVSKYYFDEYKQLITYLYDHYLTSEKIEITNYQQSEYLKQFIIQKGDILQLNDNRIVMANEVSFNQKNGINVEYIILKTDLQPGERKKVIEIKDVLFVLKREHFLEFRSQTIIKHLSVLSNWMKKRKMKLEFIPFECDFT